MVHYTMLDESEKDTLGRICRKLAALSDQSRRTGLLALEDEFDGILAELSGKNGKFARKLLMLVVDGQSEETIRTIADNYTASSCGSDFEVLCFTLIKNGVCAIQAGDHPDLLAETLISFIGFDGEEDFRQRTGFVEK